MNRDNWTRDNRDQFSNWQNDNRQEDNYRGYNNPGSFGSNFANNYNAKYGDEYKPLTPSNA